MSTFMKKNNDKNEDCLFEKATKKGKKKKDIRTKIKMKFLTYILHRL